MFKTHQPGYHFQIKILHPEWHADEKKKDKLELLITNARKSAKFKS